MIAAGGRGTVCSGSLPWRGLESVCAGRAFWTGIKCRAWKPLGCQILRHEVMADSRPSLAFHSEWHRCRLSRDTMTARQRSCRPNILVVVRILITALLISNLRATWIASSWKADSEAAILPPRMAETLGDRFADRLPQWLWPKVRIPYYIFAGVLLVGVVAAVLFAK